MLASVSLTVPCVFRTSEAVECPMARFSKNLMTMLGIFVGRMLILRQIYNNADFRKIL